jgi:hypothetical protein
MIAAHALLALSLIFAPIQAQRPSDERAIAQLTQIERDIGKANVERDYAFFDKVEADEFVFTGSNGATFTKKEDLEGLKEPASPDSRLQAYDVSELRIKLYGDAAVVTGKVVTKGLSKGKEYTSESRFTDVFVWRDGRWQIVAGHSSRLAPPRQ